jgi:hypothetical protein
VDQFHHRDRCAIAGIGASDFSTASHRATTNQGLNRLDDELEGKDYIYGTALLWQISCSNGKVR